MTENHSMSPELERNLRQLLRSMTTEQLKIVKRIIDEEMYDKSKSKGD